MRPRWSMPRSPPTRACTRPRRCARSWSIRCRCPRTCSASACAPGRRSRADARPVAAPARATAPVEPWRDATAQPFVRIEGVTKTFGKFYACDDISLDVYRGEFFALLGGSGSGKSTLLRVLAGFETPDKGRVLIDGVDVTALPPYQRPVNMMFQSYALFPHMTVAQNIAFGLKQDRLPAGEIRDRVQAMLELVQMPQLGNRKPDQLSGG